MEDKINPWLGLLQSRKFWLLILDTVVSIVALLGGVYFLPDTMELVLAFIAIMQPVFVFVINEVTQEDVALKSNPGFFVPDFVLMGPEDPEEAEG